MGRGEGGDMGGRGLVSLDLRVFGSFGACVLVGNAFGGWETWKCGGG